MKLFSLVEGCKCLQIVHDQVVNTVVLLQEFGVGPAEGTANTKVDRSADQSYHCGVHGSECTNKPF